MSAMSAVPARRGADGATDGDGDSTASGDRDATGVTARSADGEEPDAGAQSVAGEGPGTTPRSADRRVDPGATAQSEDVGDRDRDVPRAAPAAPSAGRPADAAREALRSARREALRAEAVRADSRRGSRTPARPAASAPTTTRPGGESQVARAKAAHDMRQFLTNAFRMPSWTDTSEETDDTGTEAESTHGGDTDRPDPRPSAAPAPVSQQAPFAARTPHPPTEPGPSGPAPARIPATMAAPHRDTELRRTFPAFPPRPAASQDSSFAETWWGNAWVEALEQGALDVKRLARGRGYVDQGHVDAITVTPGLVLAYVRGSRPRPYRVQVRLRTLENEDWERFLEAAADRPGHIAALLDKELPESLADCGVPLLPGPRDLAPQCSCPDSGHPCKHAAALCYQMARLLDADPFVLLLLRGRGERGLLDTLSRRSAARAARAAQERSPRSLPGVRAAEALAPRRLAPLPPPLPVPPHPEQPPVYPAAPGGPDPFALDQLATDAAARAHALLATGRDPVGELTLWQDAVRLAAARPGSGLTATTRALYATLATAVGRTPADLARAVAAWRQGGLAGLAVLEEPWDPPAGRFDRARPLLLAADLPAFRPRRNRLTHPGGHVQLRLGRDGLWYAYESEPDHDDWWPRGTPDLDPVGALTGLGTPDDL
ncbi:SWIM zinc finger family protein [Streptomyces griseochromogenes]|uniref:SWIM zinc finger family protein n=1 Tax=Streptomyces griseochromogenes TaxID=68214 RepID=UPI0037A66628